MKDSPSTTLYQLGKGILSIADYDDACPAPSYTDLGNCPRFEVEVTEEILDHFSSRSGARNLDKTVILEVGYNLAFDLDEWSKQNLQIYTKGTLTANKIKANMQLTKEYILKFVSDNPEGPNETWEFHRCKISPGGALGLISDEWGMLSYTAKGLSDAVCNSTSPYFDVTFCTTTTTSSTTSTTSTTA